MILHKNGIFLYNAVVIDVIARRMFFAPRQSRVFYVGWAESPIKAFGDKLREAQHNFVGLHFIQPNLRFISTIKSMLNFLKSSLKAGLIFFISSWASLCYAEESPRAPSLGDMSQNMYQTFGMFANVLYNVCYVIGAAFIAGSIIQYKAYRDNPLQVPINRPILLLFFGLVLIAFPFIARLSSGAPT
jgi:hypothetical protein